MKKPIKFHILLLLLLPLFLEAKERVKLVPIIEEIKGQGLWSNPSSGQYFPFSVGQILSEDTKIIVSSESEITFSCAVGIAGRITGPAEITLGPAEGNRYEANMKRGTIAILLDPERPRGSPQFAVRTKDGLALARGTFYAITEYKGQTFVKVKTGSIKAKTKPPIKRNFAAYKKIDTGKSSKN